MKMVRIKAILSAISVIALVLCAIIPQSPAAITENDPSTTVSTHTAATQGSENSGNDTANEAVTAKATSDEITVWDEETLKARFLSMLNINNCFNGALADEEAVAKCVATSLADYAQDKVGYGLCVSSYLVAGFAESFYGISLEAGLVDQEAPNGYISLPQMGMDFNVHSLVSLTEAEDGYEVLTCMKSYQGGEEYDTCLVKSKFVQNNTSEFGFNLVSCETLG